jgi:metal-responsive CopG/Arc/MetJ family transcriptional regulator
MNRSATFSFPESILELIEEIKRKRRDPTRSDTVRVLLLQALAVMNYIPTSEKKALGILNREQPPLKEVEN